MAKTKTTTSLDNVKLRHLTGAYLHLDDAPIDEDIIYFLENSKLKSAALSDIINSFGEHKSDKVEAVVRSLHVKSKLTTTIQTDPDLTIISLI